MYTATFCLSSPLFIHWGTFGLIPPPGCYTQRRYQHNPTSSCVGYVPGRGVAGTSVFKSARSPVVSRTCRTISRPYHHGTGPGFFTSLSTLAAFPPAIAAIPQVWSDVSLWLWFVFPWSLVIVNIFAYSLWPFVDHCWRNFFQMLCPFLDWHFCFLLLSSKSSLYILDINPPSDRWLASIFSKQSLFKMSLFTFLLN